MLSGDKIDYLPSQLDFVPQRYARLLKELNMNDDEFNEWADNHFFHVYPLTESCYYSSGSEEDEKLIKLAVTRGVIDPHPNDHSIYDNFHVAWLKNVYGDGIRDVENPLENTAIEDYKWPDPTISGLFDHLIDDLRKRSEQYYVVGLQHLTFFERSFLLFGYQKFMIKLIMDIKAVENVMDRIYDFHIELARRFVQLGVDAVRTGDDWGMQDGLQINPKLWRKLIKPRIAKIWEFYRESGITVMHHSCGNIEEIIPDLIEMGLKLLHPVQPLAMSIESLSKKYGKQLAFHGGIDTQRLLPFGTPQDIIEAVKHCVETLGSNGKYIIAPSQEIMNDVPTDNIKALVEGIHKYRGMVFL